MNGEIFSIPSPLFVESSFFHPNSVRKKTNAPRIFSLYKPVPSFPFGPNDLHSASDVQYAAADVEQEAGAASPSRGQEAAEAGNLGGYPME